ncbi:MAG: triose-phosphate isomerase, partial [Candidatus Dormibacteria bacterium]
TVPEGVELARAIVALERPPSVEVAVLPPFPHLWPVCAELRGTGIGLGAQDCFWEDAGAFTGEVSPGMLAGWCDMVLVGHSERRHILGESSEQVGRKLRRALEHPLRVILAVGELSEERDAGSTLHVCHHQLDAALDGLDAAALSRVVVAYEPVWAIGTGRTATPEQAQEVCAAIRTHAGELVSAEAAAGLLILYGGSVTDSNAMALFAEPDIDGGLIGGASLKPQAFGAIVAAAAATANVTVDG